MSIKINNVTEIKQDEFKRKLRWVGGEIITDPQADTTLVAHACSYGKKTFIHGYHISTTDIGGNTFLIRWLNNGQVKTWEIVFPANGTAVIFEEYIAINERSHADPQSQLTITCLKGGAGMYQAAVCIAEEVL